MAQMNVARPKAAPVFTHQGGKAVRTSAHDQLQRAVLTCLLWEDNFYESGQETAKRIQDLVPKVAARDVAELAYTARKDYGLRHVPLLLIREMARGSADHKSLVEELLHQTISRPDEIAEFISLYWKTNDGKKSLPAAVKRGLAKAFSKFSPHQIAKWERSDKEVTLRDAMFLVHAKPGDLPEVTPRWTRTERKHSFKNNVKRTWEATEKEELQFKLAQNNLKQTGTWEDRMSAGEDAKVVFTDLMEKGELGGLAFIRNLRKMEEAGVDRAIIETYSQSVSLRGIFPHQVLTAARVNPTFESMLDLMQLRALEGGEKLPGKTVVLVDVSGSMAEAVSKRPAAAVRPKRGMTQIETTRLDAACGLAIAARETCENVRVFTFSDRLVEVPNRRGMALRDAIVKSQQHSGTQMGAAVNQVSSRVEYDRLIVITDEQSSDGSGTPRTGSAAYIMNVSSYEHGVGNTKEWTTVSGWSQHLLRYIAVMEGQTAGEVLLN